MQPIPFHQVKARIAGLTPVAVLLTMLLAIVLPGLTVTGAAGQTGDDAGDTYLDPVAYSRVAPDAEGIPLTIKYQATGETRRAMGLYLLVDSQEMYLRSATLAISRSTIRWILNWPNFY